MLNATRRLERAKFAQFRGGKLVQRNLSGFLDSKFKPYLPL
jgi:hypothetical protein